MARALPYGLVRFGAPQEDFAIHVPTGHIPADVVAVVQQGGDTGVQWCSRRAGVRGALGCRGVVAREVSYTGHCCMGSMEQELLLATEF